MTYLEMQVRFDQKHKYQVSIRYETLKCNHPGNITTRLNNKE